MAKKVKSELRVIKGEVEDISPIMKSLKVLLAYQQVNLVFFNELMLDCIKHIQVLSAGAATNIDDLFKEPKVDTIRDIYYLSRIVGDCLRIISSNEINREDVKNIIYSINNILSK
jgi:hypothetical protein